MGEKKVLEVMVIEDDLFSVAILEHYGKKLDDFILNIHHTVSLEDSLVFLDNNPQIEIIFLDYRVHSNITGLEILQHLRARGINIPVIIITGSGNEEVAVAMMKAGASDYLVKGHISPTVLNKSIRDVLSKYNQMNKSNIDKDSFLKDMAIQTSLNGVCILDLNYMITYVNPSLVNMWGYDSEKEIVGKPIRDLLYSPGDCDKVIEGLKNKKSWAGELIAKKKNLDTFYVQSLFSFLKINKEDKIGLVASFIDITKIKEAEKKREALYKGIMEVFALRAEEVGNVETAGHIHRIASYVRFITEKLRELDYFKDYIDEKYINDVSYASMLHDVGKWRTPNEILLKPHELTEAEWKIMRQHPLLGVEMLTPLLKYKGSNQYLKLVESVILYHHERWDGKGYPEGLKGEEIPLSARIVALADMYDALTSHRSYRKALTHEEAFEVMKREKERFDPRIWKVFEKNHLEFKRIRESIE